MRGSTDLVTMWGVKLELSSVWHIIIDLISLEGVGIELVSVGQKSPFFLASGPKMTWFCVIIEIDVFFQRVAENFLIYVCEVEMDFIYSTDGHSLAFCVEVAKYFVIVSGWRLTDLAFCVEIDWIIECGLNIILISALGSQLTWMCGGSRRG